MLYTHRFGHCNANPMDARAGIIRLCCIAAGTPPCGLRAWPRFDAPLNGGGRKSMEEREP